MAARVRWTAQRRKLLILAYPQGMLPDDLHARINAMPGAPIPRSLVISYATRVLKLRREPDGWPWQINMRKRA